MRHAVALTLAACASGSGSQLDIVVTHARGPIHGSHAAAIDLVAITDDGGAAVSQDGVAGTRLWPALDGSREPIVVRAPMARELGLARDGDGFAIAALDGVGGVDLVRIDAVGAQQSRVQIGSDPAIAEIVMTTQRLLALRADQTLVTYDFGGAQIARLVPAEGDRIESVLARHGRVLALVRGEQMRGRWIVDGGTRWGTLTPALTVTEPKLAVLSPDGTKLAVARRRDVAFVDLAIGYETKPFICPSISENKDGLEEMQAATAPMSMPIGFETDSRLACFAEGRIEWWDDTAHGTVADGGSHTFETSAVGDGVVVTTLRGQLVLQTAKGLQYLGYDLASIRQARVAPAGLMISKGDQQPLLLDETLHERRHFALAGDARDLTDVLALDDRYVLVSHSETSGDVPAHKIALVDTLLHTVRQELPYAVIAADIRYEPATRLLVVSDRDGPMVVRLDPVEMRFGEPVRFDDGTRTRHDDADVHLVDPALGQGVVAVVIHSYSGRLELREFVELGAPAPRQTYELFGPLESVDRAGRAYVRVEDGIAVYAHTAKTRVAHMVGVAKDMIVRPSPEASSVAVLGDQVLRLYRADGPLVWQRVATLATDTGWAHGDLLLRWPDAVAALDPATGEATARACGWSFGLAAVPHDDTGISETESVCDAE